MKNLSLMAVFYVALCVSCFAGGNKESSANSSSSHYLFEQNFAKNDVLKVDVENSWEGSYSYIPNIGFSAGKRIIYNGTITLLDFIIPDSALAVLNKDELQLLRNSIYAKHGMIFQSNDLKAHFQQFNWYNPRNNNVERLLTEDDKTNIKNIQTFENAQPNNNLSKKEIIGKGLYFYPVPDWSPEITINDDNTIEWIGGGEDNFKGTYKIENGFLVVLVTEQIVGTANYFQNKSWNWPKGVTYSNYIVKYKEPIKMVFPVGDMAIFESNETELMQKRQIGSISWIFSLDYEELFIKLDSLMQERAVELAKARVKNADVEKISYLESLSMYIKDGYIVIPKNVYRVSMRGNILGLIGHNVDVIITGEINFRNNNINILEANVR